MTSISSNTVEQMILDTVTQCGSMPAPIVHKEAQLYASESPSDKLRPARWAIRASVAGSKEPVTR
jgi:hypothetical protein